MNFEVFCKELEKIMREFIKNKKVFCNEYQFQFALAFEIKNKLGLDIFSEVPISHDESNKDRLDILVFLNKNEYVAIELKYKTSKAEIEDIELKNHSAQDNGCFGFWLDVERLENFCSGKYSPYGLKEVKCVGGIALMLTNDKLYWNDSKRKSRYDNFKLFNKRVVENTTHLKWEGDEEVIKKAQPTRYQGINLLLGHKYTIEWKTENDAEFKYLLLQIQV